MNDFIWQKSSRSNSKGNCVEIGRELTAQELTLVRLFRYSIENGWASLLKKNELYSIEEMSVRTHTYANIVLEGLTMWDGPAEEWAKGCIQRRGDTSYTSGIPIQIPHVEPWNPHIELDATKVESADDIIDAADEDERFWANVDFSEQAWWES